VAKFKVVVGGKTRRTFRTKRGAEWFKRRLGKGKVAAAGKSGKSKKRRGRKAPKRRRKASARRAAPRRRKSARRRR
jgi:hypothetical protein